MVNSSKSSLVKWALSYRVPLVEGLHELLVCQAADSLEHIVGLADELHVAILDAVVHHLDEIAGTPCGQQ